MAGAAVDVRDVSKRYGDHQALNHVSLTIHQGEIFGIIGPNGAGKSTLVGIIAGLRDADSGKIDVLGKDVVAERASLRHEVGIQLQEAQLQELITVEEALRLYSSFYEHPNPWEPLLDDWGLRAKRKDRFGNLSGGQKQRLFIALALISNPKLVILDELTTGLDPQARRESWEHVERIRDSGTTIILVSHFMEEAERLCDRIAVIDGGEIRAIGPVADLLDNDTTTLRLGFTAPPTFDEYLLEGLDGVIDVGRTGEQINVTGTGYLMATVSHALAALKLNPPDIHMEQDTLEDVFIRLTGTEQRD
ncbi:MAG: ABC transporter ATP-binding protein [Thermomicrobiales bacterium]